MSVLEVRPVPPAPWQRLCECIGLSEYEARVYVFLVAGGASEARKISMACGIPRTKVYGTLRKLKERGLVIETPDKPRRYAPTSPEEAFKAYLQAYEAKERDLHAVISTLESAYERVKGSVKQNRETVWVLWGRDRILRRACEMLSRARSSVDIITTECGLVLLHKAGHRLLDKLAEEDVEIQIVAPTESKGKNLTQELAYMSRVRYTDPLPPILFLCVDKVEFLLANLTSNDLSLVSEGDVGAFSQNSTLSSLISQLLLTKEKGETSIPVLSPLLVKSAEMDGKVANLE